MCNDIGNAHVIMLSKNKKRNTNLHLWYDNNLKSSKKGTKNQRKKCNNGYWCSGQMPHCSGLSIVTITQQIFLRSCPHFHFYLVHSFAFSLIPGKEHLPRFHHRSIYEAIKSRKRKGNQAGPPKWQIFIQVLHFREFFLIEEIFLGIIKKS